MTESGITIEQEIAQLEKQIADKRVALGQEKMGSELPSEKETLREVIGEKIQQQVPQYQPLSPTQTRQGGAKPQTDDIAQSSVLPELKEKIQELINLVFNKSLNEGIKEVSKINNPALTDAFHDVLVDELYNVLLERKKLESVK